MTSESCTTLVDMGIEFRPGRAAKQKDALADCMYGGMLDGYDSQPISASRYDTGESLAQEERRELAYFSLDRF